MNKLIKSSLYKLLRDWTFRITLIIGAALAVFMCLIYFGIDLISGNWTTENVGSMCNGFTFYTSALSPTQNFGLTVPINLIVFTIGEFSCGTIRNKIIAGNKKSSIYLSLIITGIIFTLSLMLIYYALSVGIASAIGGFKGLDKAAFDANIDTKILYQYPLIGLATYIFIVTFAVLISTSVRNIGGAMPIVIITIVFLYFLSFMPSVIGMIDPDDTKKVGLIVQSWTNPLYGFGTFGLSGIGLGNALKTEDFIASVVTPIYWSGIFTALGILVFNKKDVK